MLQVKLDQCIQKDREALRDNRYCSLYNTVKLDFCTEPYLMLNLNFFIKRMLFQLRCGQNYLYVYRYKFVIHPDSLCTYCNLNVMESWEHIFMSCTHFQVYRSGYLTCFKDWVSLINFKNHVKSDFVNMFLFIVECCKDIQRM